MTHAELVARAERWLLNTMGCGFVLTEFSTAAGEIPDAIGWKNSWSYLVECKASRADFLADKRKMHRRCPDYALGNHHYYMCEPGIVEATDLPENWGLLHVRNGRVKIVRDAVPDPNPAIAVSERLILCSALRRVHIRGDLAKIYDYGSLR